MRANNGMCHLCGQGGADSIDHIVPVAWGGSDDPSNLAPAHTSCNSRKRDAAPPPWTYTRPSMWLPGFGPNGGPASKRGKSFWTLLLWGFIALIGFMVLLGIFQAATGGSTGSTSSVPGKVSVPDPVESSPYFLDSATGQALERRVYQRWDEMTRKEKIAACAETMTSNQHPVFPRAIGLSAADVKLWDKNDDEDFGLDVLESQFCTSSGGAYL